VPSLCDTIATVSIPSRSIGLAKTLGILALAAAFAACVTSPTGRSTVKLYSAAQMDGMGVQSFEQLKEQTPQSRDAALNRYVGCVASAITRTLGPGESNSWEVVVFKDNSANAFALPGKKIGVHTGLLAVAKNQDQLASVMGHEVGHVLAGHANERISAATGTNLFLQTASILLGGGRTPGNRAILQGLGLGAQFGFALPFGRSHESESDILGLDMMATAGFDPRESVELWRNMARAGGGQPPEWMSTHPSHDTRIAQLQERMRHALELREQAIRAGRRPQCD